MSRHLSYINFIISNHCTGRIFASTGSFSETAGRTVQVIASSGNGSNPDRGSNSDRYPDSSSGPISGGDSSNQPFAEVPRTTFRLIAQADRIAMGYDYDKAAEFINSSGLTHDFPHDEALARYELRRRPWFQPI